MGRDTGLTRQQKVTIAALMLGIIATSGVAAYNGATPVGPGTTTTCQTSAPAPAGQPRYWTRCSDGASIYTDASNVDHVQATPPAAGVVRGDIPVANGSGGFIMQGPGSDGQCLIADSASSTGWTAGTCGGGGGGGGGYATVEENAIALTQRATLNFSSVFNCVDNAGALRTDCDLATTGVTASTYGDATHVGQFTVTDKGRITSASNVAITGTLPSQTGNAGKILTTNGSSASWEATSATMSCTTTGDCATGYQCVSNVCAPTMQTVYDAGNYVVIPNTVPGCTTIGPSGTCNNGFIIASPSPSPVGSLGIFSIIDKNKLDAEGSLYTFFGLGDDNDDGGIYGTITDVGNDRLLFYPGYTTWLEVKQSHAGKRLALNQTGGDLFVKAGNGDPTGTFNGGTTHILPGQPGGSGSVGNVCLETSSGASPNICIGHPNGTGASHLGINGGNQTIFIDSGLSTDRAIELSSSRAALGVGNGSTALDTTQPYIATNQTTQTIYGGSSGTTINIERGGATDRAIELSATRAAVGIGNGSGTVDTTKAAFISNASTIGMYGGSSGENVYMEAGGAGDTTLTVTPSTGVTLNKTFTTYNNETTAGVGNPYLRSVTQSTASLGSATTIATLTTPATGLYRVSIAASAHTNNDTVSSTITYTEADEGFATTEACFTSVVLTHDSNTGKTECTHLIRASAATNIVCNLSATTQTTTHASCTIERLN